MVYLICFPFSLPPSHSTCGRWDFRQGKLRLEQEIHLHPPGGGSGATFCCSHLPGLLPPSPFPDPDLIERFYYFSSFPFLAREIFFFFPHPPRPCLPADPRAEVGVKGKAELGGAGRISLAVTHRPLDPGEWPPSAGSGAHCTPSPLRFFPRSIPGIPVDWAQ